MLKIYMESIECLNEATMKFVTIPARAARFEHSLLSISKWESKYHKKFLGSDKTVAELQDYICTMCLDDIDPIYISTMSAKNMELIEKYIEDSMTATTFSAETNRTAGLNREVFTSEVIYYYMFTFGIPKECEKWHINRLLTLLKIFSIKNQDPKKPNKKDIFARNRAINAANRARYHSKG